ncbi:MAG: glutamate racemase, partial [Hyphomicrobiales bacterium]
QQNDLARLDPRARVLGVIRPTAEVVGNYSGNGAIAVLATNGTVQSKSYELEIAKFFPQLEVVQEACPMWVPLIENKEHDGPGADFFVKKHVDAVLGKHANVDTVLLACTHYPLLLQKIRSYLPEGVQVLAQGDIVAESLEDYLQRHPEIETRLSKDKERAFYTTDSTSDIPNGAEPGRFAPSGR